MRESQTSPFQGIMMSDVYGMLYLLAGHAKMGYWGYVSSKLDLDASDKSSAVAQIEEKRKAVRSESDAGWMIDGAMRAAMEMVRNGGVQLTFEEIAASLNCLGPISQIHDNACLIERHRSRDENR